ncbi:unnamed protein product, partial [Scytosiphon promiscuus]
MYRVSREGRRASTHDQDPDSRLTRYKERFDNSSSDVSAPAAFHDKSFPAGRPNAFSTRYPRMTLCLKVSAVLLGLFFTRRVHRSMCPAPLVLSGPRLAAAATAPGEASLETELRSIIVGLERKLEKEKAAKKAVEAAMEDLRTNERGWAGMPGSRSDGQQRGAEAQAEDVGYREEQGRIRHTSDPLVHAAGGEEAEGRLSKGDVQNLLTEKLEVLEETRDEVKDLTAKNKYLLEQVETLEKQIESRRQLALGIQKAEASQVEQQQQQVGEGGGPSDKEPPEETHQHGGAGTANPRTIKNAAVKGEGEHEEKDGGKRVFYENPDDVHEGHQSNKPGELFEKMDGWIMDGESDNRGGDEEGGRGEEGSGDAGNGGDSGDGEEDLLAGVVMDMVPTSDGDNHQMEH